MRIILQILREHNFKAKRNKCEFDMARVTYLGHVIDSDGVHMDPAKVEAVANWPTPTSGADLRRFLGLAGYMRRYIKGFAKTTSCLHELTKLSTKWSWTSEHQKQFQALKTAIITAPVLAYPDYEKPFIIHTDASGFATGAVLLQDHGRGLQPLAYFSHSMNPAERNYPVHEQELLAVVLALRAWRCYVEGAPFEVYTDHHTLQYLRSQPILSRRQARWSEELALYDATIKYIPGEKNRADALSRRPDLQTASAVVSSTTVQPDASLMDDLQAAYEDDYLVSQDSTRAAHKRQLELRDGLYYSAKGLGLYLPEALRERMMRECHDTPLAGHFGMDEPTEQVRRCFWWPRLSASVAAFVQGCHTCQTTKASNQRTAGLLQPLPVPDYPFQQITMDLVTALPAGASGNDAVVVFVDRLSKMVHFAAIKKTITAEELAAVFFNHVVKLHGLPEAIISDRDPKFTSDFWQALFAKLGTRLKMSTPAHPQSDGQSERSIRTLLQVLRAYTQPDGRKWEQHLAAVEFSVNNARQDSTQLSPFEVVHGRRPRVPLDCSVLPMDSPGPSHSLAPSPAADSFVEHLKRRQDRARDAMERASARQKYYHDQHRRESDIQTGDEVLVDATHFGPRDHKLSPLYLGPFWVIERQDNTVLVSLPHHLNRRHNRVNIGLAKKYTPGASADRLDFDSQYHDVEKVIDMQPLATPPGRRGRKPMAALCKWRRLPWSECSWTTDLSTMKRLIQAFKARGGPETEDLERVCGTANPSPPDSR